MAIADCSLQHLMEVPWVVSFYGADAYRSPLEAKRRRYAQVFDKASLVLALGPVMKAQLESLGCPAEKIVIHPLGVNVESLPSRTRILKPGEPLRIVFAGAFREKKGIQYLIEAAAIARQAGVRFHLQLVGDAGTHADRETKKAVFRLIHHLDLEDVVTHQTFLPFQQLIDLALHSHVFVAPSATAADGDAEGTPFVLQQMMATGMPAIATAHSDNPFLFGDHAHLLVPERDASAIADRIRRYWDAPDTLVSDGTALRNQTRRVSDVRRCAARLSELYDSIS
jgi:colanic acid/amylovoran biosynthesis glycosyltransferase